MNHRLLLDVVAVALSFVGAAPVTSTCPAIGLGAGPCDANNPWFIVGVALLGFGLALMIVNRVWHGPYTGNQPTENSGEVVISHV